MARQYIEPNRNALVEVYANRAGELRAGKLADLWERQARQGKVPYVAQRLSSQEVAVEGNPAVLRGYQGLNQGRPVEALILYVIHGGKAYVVVGVWATAGGEDLGRTVRRCVTSLRFSDPTSAPKTRAAAPKPDSAKPLWLGSRKYGYWIAAPGSWDAKRERQADYTMFMLKPPGAEGGLAVWAGKLQGVAEVQQLASSWESQSSESLPNLSRRSGDCGSADWKRLGRKDQVACRRYTGVVKGTPTASTVLYALRGEVGYVVMATYRQGNTEQKLALEKVMRTFRLTPPGTADQEPQKAQGRPYYQTGFDDLNDWQGTAQRRILREGVARVHSQNHTTFELKPMIPVEDVVVQWRGAGYNNGFHGNLGPYLFNIGGFGNSASGAAGPGVPFKKLQHGKVYDKGKFQIWRLERQGDRFSAYVDGKLIFARDIPRKAGERMGRLVFTSYHSDLDLDWLKVMPAGATPPTASSTRPPALSAEELAQVVPSATLKVMAESPPMELIEQSNLFYTGGINGMYPQAAALKAEHAKIVPDAFAAIHAMGERLDFLHNASREYDRLGNQQFAYWCGLNATDPKFAFPYGLEKSLMKKRGALQGAEEALWVAINQLRLELGRVTQENPKVPANQDLVQCRLYVQLLGRSLDLIDFYKNKAEALLIPTATVHGTLLNPSFGLPAGVVAKVKGYLQPEMDQAVLMATRVYESWDLAFIALGVVERLDGINRKLASFGLHQIARQYRSLSIQEVELRRAGYKDEAEVIRGVLDSYQVILDSPQLNEYARGPAGQGIKAPRAASLAERLFRLLGPSPAYADWRDTLRRYANKGIEGGKWLAKGTAKVAKRLYRTAGTMVNAQLEVFDNVSNVTARVLNGVEDRGMKELAGDFVNTFGVIAEKVHKGVFLGQETSLGQKTTEKALASFNWADENVVGKGVWAQAAVNAATLGGYGLAKDVLIINDDRASGLDKAGAALGAALNFVPIANFAGKAAAGLKKVGGKVVAGLAKGTLKGGKSALGAAGRLAKRSLQVIVKNGWANEAAARAQAMVRFQKFLLEKGTPAGMLTKLYKGIMRANTKVIAKEAALAQSKQRLKASIKRGLTHTLKQSFKGFKEGFRGGVKKGLEQGVKLGVDVGGAGGKKGLTESIKKGLAYGWGVVSGPYKETSKVLLKNLLHPVDGAGLALGFKYAVKNTSQFMFEGTVSQAAQEGIKQGAVSLASGGKAPNRQARQKANSGPSPAKGMEQRTWKLPDLGPGGMRDKKPVKRPVDLLISHSNTGDGFGTMTYKGRGKLLLKAQISYPRRRGQYPRYITGLNIQILDPSGKAIASQWGDVGDGFSGYSPGLSASVVFTLEQAVRNPGKYTVVFIKKRNSNPGGKPVFSHERMMVQSIYLRQAMCLVGAKKDPAGGPHGMRGQPCGEVLGKWKWFTGTVTTITADGRVNGDPTLTWRCLGKGHINIDWRGKWLDDLRLSPDGTRLDGKNQGGYKVSGTRIGSPRKAWYRFRMICNQTYDQAKAALEQAGYKKAFGPADRQQCQQWIDQQRQLMRE